jgi:putative heme-binding domain-containing protein
LDDAARQALLHHSDESVRAQAEPLIAMLQPGDRSKVLADYQSSLQLAGDRIRGAKIFTEQCATCHAIHGKGKRVGPDLTGAASRAKETLLIDLLDPSRQISPDFVSYAVQSTDGQTYTGLLAAESSTGITLRQADGVEQVIKRKSLEQLRPTGKSLMPDGLEQKISLQDAADLLEFLQRPDRELIDVVK